MAKFITGQDLEKVIYDIIWEAEHTLLIVSPFIKLDGYFKELFDKHSVNPKVHLLIVFGKNEMEISKSLSKDDFDYFKKFLNITVVYVPNLHAKYYGNEKKGVITSINLYDYSFKNNIEFGVYSELNILNKFKTSADQEAWHTCKQIAEENEVVFVKRPVYEKKLLSALLGKNYIKSDVLHDITNSFYQVWGNSNQKRIIKKLVDFPSELDLSSVPKVRPTRKEVENAPKDKTTLSSNGNQYGYCIRTGIKITFNIERPLSYEAYRKWNEFGDPNYPERFCHFSGEPSNGGTSVNRPILNKNWKQAKDVFDLSYDKQKR